MHKRVRDRIKDFRRVPANQIRPNPKNWRTHPDDQRTVLRDLLSEVGIAGAVLARELPDGSLELIDGHLRREELGSQEVPVLILDVTESEANLILATHDPVAAMASADGSKVDELLRSIQTSSQPIADLLTELAAKSQLIPVDTEPRGSRGSDEYDEIRTVIQYTLIFDDEDQQEAWFRLVRTLKTRYPDEVTIGARVARHAEDSVEHLED